MPKAQPVEVIDLPELRSLEINELFEEMDELDCPIDMINERLILDGAYGYQSSITRNSTTLLTTNTKLVMQVFKLLCEL